MGQIVGGAAKPKRCNLNKLSQLGTPAAGEYILVSSDNSMNAAGQGNFDCYIEGNGTTAAMELPLNKLNDGPELGESTADLDIADESGNILARFEHGNIEVKNFNSSNAVCATNDNNGKDLIICDEEGNTLVEFNNGHIKTKNFDSSDIPIDSSNIPIDRHRRFGYIGSPDIYLANIPSVVCSSSTQASEVYSIYDALLANYPDYVTKNNLGQDSAGNNIYEYVFAQHLPEYGKATPSGNDYTIKYQDWPQDPRPVELIMSGVHGDEKGSVWGLALLMQELCASTSGDALYFIKLNTVVKVIPIVNVYGFNHDSRLNYNGVNINRDYVNNSQPETQVIRSWFDANYETSICIYDFHNTVTRSCLWNNSKQYTTQSMMLTFSRVLESSWRTVDNSLNNYDDLLVYNDFDTESTSEGFFFLNYGALSSVIESCRSSEGLKGITTFTFNALGIKSGMDLLGNMMIMAITLMR